MAFARAGPGAKRQRVAFWQLALAASALILLGLNVGAVFNSNFPANSDNVDEVGYISSGGSRFRNCRRKDDAVGYPVVLCRSWSICPTRASAG